jgi:signal transduction histidine kinase
MNAVNRLPQLKNHPFRLLLYLEWILLAITILGEFPWDNIPGFGTLLSVTSDTPELFPYAWLLNIVCLSAFGFMGLWLPQKKTMHTWLYTALELGIIWLVTGLGNWNTSFLSPYLIVVIRSCLIFKPAERLIATGIIFLSFLISLLISVPDIQKIQDLTGNASISLNQIRLTVIILTINSAFLFGLALVFVLMLVNALLSERSSRQKLAIAHDQLRQYALRIENQAILQERNRIAREIHDSLGHALTAQSIQLENALLFCYSNSEKAHAFLSEAKQLASMALKEIRQSVSALRSDPLQGRTLKTAITNLIDDFHKRTTINPDYTIDLFQPISTDISIALYRIVQEALTNISKHSDPTQVRIEIKTTGKTVHLRIEDNGKGFNPHQNTTGFGLQGMRERTLALGGSFLLESDLGQGCRISVDIPLVKVAL